MTTAIDAEIIDSLENADDLSMIAELCRASYRDFVHMFWSEVPGAGQKPTWNWHMDLFCAELETIAERVFRNEPKEYDLVVNVSPGTSKSSLFSILFQPWTWTRMPQARHLIATYTHQLALDLSTKSRYVVESAKYRELFPEIVLSDVQDAKNHWANTLGGSRITATVSGKSPGGFHNHFIGLDDLLDPRGAISVAELQNARHFITNEIPSRVINKGVTPTILVMQRLRGTIDGRGAETEDPTGVMLEVSKKDGASPIRHICLPARLTDFVRPSEAAERYTDGLMDPVRMGEQVLRDFEVRLGPFGFSSQFLQAPVQFGGGMFKPEYFNKRAKAAPYKARRIRFWDRAATSGAGCATAGVLMAKAENGDYYVEDVVHGHWEPDDRNRRMRATALKDRARYGPNNEPEIWVEAEGGSSGRDAWKMVARALEGFNCREARVTGKKDVRAEPWAAACAAGIVWIVEGDWDIVGYIDEHLRFRPEYTQKRGVLVDRIDASSGAFNLMAGARVAGPLRILSLRGGKKTCRVVVCNQDDLAENIIEEPAILVSIQDPPGNGVPMSALNRKLGELQLAFADIEPSEYQDKWQERIPAFDELPEKLIANRDIAKKLWAFLLRRWEPSPLVYVFQDSGDKRALSVAMAFCDTMGFDRNIIHRAGVETILTSADKAPNQHVYATVKAGRSMVIA